MDRDIILKLRNTSFEEILERNVSQFGTGGHIIVPQKHIGKKVIIIIKDEIK